MRKIAAPANSRSARKTPKRRKSNAEKIADAPEKYRRRKSAPCTASGRRRPVRASAAKTATSPICCGRPRPPTRLTLERALADLRRHPAAICRADDAEGLSGPFGRRLARVALLTPQTVGVIIRNLERDGAIRKTPHPVHGRVLQWTPDPPRRNPARQMPPPRQRRGTAAGGRAWRARPQATIRRWLSKIAADLQQDG